MAALEADAELAAEEERRIELMRKKIDDGGFETPYRLRKQVVEPVFGQNQTGARLPPVPVARRRESTCRVGHDLHHPQSPETFHPRKGRLRRLPCNKCPAAMPIWTGS
jgi:hypothetical protein